MVIDVVYLSLSITENYNDKIGLLTTISVETSPKASIGFQTYLIITDVGNKAVPNVSFCK